MILLPRLENHEADLVIVNFHNSDPGPEGARDVIAGLGLRPHWNRSGGMPASESQRTELADTLREKAREYGYPIPPDLASQQAFDRAACRILAADPMLARAGGDTRRPACWAGLTVFDMPDLAVWRHGGSGASLSIDRLRGGPRNFLRRLWLRIKALHVEDNQERDGWFLIDDLTEDAIVQIIERPSLAAFPPLSHAIGIAWQEHAQARQNMEEIMRVATKRLRARSEILALGLLDEEGILEEVRRTFDEAIHIIGKRAKATFCSRGG